MEADEVTSKVAADFCLSIYAGLPSEVIRRVYSRAVPRVGDFLQFEDGKRWEIKTVTFVIPTDEGEENTNIITDVKLTVIYADPVKGSQAAKVNVNPNYRPPSQVAIIKQKPR